MTFGDALIGDWIDLLSIPSTQTAAAASLPEPVGPSVVFAHHQTAGRGRFDRRWWTGQGDSIAMTLILRGAPHHPKPWLLGMQVAAVFARDLGVFVQWPNDLVCDGSKVGGILTEIIEGVPLIGVGINVSQQEFSSELASRATSLALLGKEPRSPIDIAKRLVDALAPTQLPESWADVRKFWEAVDQTVDKPYLLPKGGVADAVEVGDDGALVARAEEGLVRVFAADAWFGAEA